MKNLSTLRDWVRLSITLIVLAIIVNAIRIARVIIISRTFMGAVVAKAKVMVFVVVTFTAMCKDHGHGHL